MRALERRHAVLHGVRERVFCVRIVPPFARRKPRAHQLACAVEGVFVLLANRINYVSHAGSPVLAWALVAPGRRGAAASPVTSINAGVHVFGCKDASGGGMVS